MALAETAVLAVDLKLTGATQFKSGIAEADAAALSLGKTVSTSSNILGGSASNFGLVKQAAISTGTALKGMGEHLKGVLTGPLGLLGLGAGLFTLGGILKAGTEEASAFGFEVAKLQALTGGSVEEISALSAALDHFGISGDAAIRTVGMLEKNTGILATTLDKYGHNKLAAFTNQFGLSLTDAQGHLVSFNEEILRTADYFNNQNIPATTKAAALAKLYGRSWQTLIPFLAAGRKGIEEAEQAAKDLGLTLTAQNLGDLKQYRENFLTLGDATKGLQLQLGLVLIPLLADLAKSFTNFLRTGGRDKIVSFFKDIVQNAKDFGHVITGTIIPTLTGLAGAAKGFWDSIPAPLRDLLFKGIVADRTIHFLFGVSPIHLVASLAEGAVSTLVGHLFQSFAQRGSSPVNPLFVSDIAGGAGGPLSVVDKGAVGLLSTLVSLAVPIAAVVGLMAAGSAGADQVNRERGTNFRMPAGFLDFPTIISNLVEAIKVFTDHTPRERADEIYGPSTSMTPLNAQGGVAGPYGPFVTALKANTAALHTTTSAYKGTAAEARKAIDADRAARGIKGGGISTSLDPRLRFLAGEHSAAKDLAVAHAIVVGFQRAVTPLFRKTSEIPRAIKSLEADQRQLAKAGDTKGAAAIGREIKALKAELARRVAENTAKTVAAQAKTAAAVHAQGIIAAAAVKDADQNALVATADTTSAVNDLRGRIEPKITTVAGNVDKARSGIVAAARGTTTATYHGAASVVGAIRANRPIVTTIVNVSATTVQQKTTVVERYGPTSGDRNGSNGSGTQGNGGP